MKITPHCAVMAVTARPIPGKVTSPNRVMHRTGVLLGGLAYVQKEELAKPKIHTSLF